MARKTNAFDYGSEMLKALQSIDATLNNISEKVKSTVNEAKKGVSDIAKTTNSADANRKKAAKELKQIQKQAVDYVFRVTKDTNELYLKTAKDVQRYTGATMSQYNTLYKGLLASTRKLNSELSSGLFNSSDLLNAANKLASIGWSDLKAIESVTPALAKVSTALGNLSDNFYNTVTRLQRVFKEGTSKLVESLGNTMAAYSKIDGVTASQIEGALTSMSDLATYISKGNAETYSQMQNSIAKATALYSKMGVSTQASTSLMSQIATASSSQLQQYSTAMGISGNSLLEIQTMLNEGRFDEASQALLTGIGDRINSATSDLERNQYLSMMSGFGFTTSELLAVASNTANMSTYLAEIQSASEDQNALTQRLQDKLVTAFDRLRNTLSASPLVAGINETAGALGIGSLKDVEALSSMYTRLSPIIKGNGGLLASLQKVSPLLGKMAIAAGIAVLVFEAFDKIWKDESFAETKEQIMGIVETLKSLFSDTVDVINPVVEMLIDTFAGALADNISEITPAISKIMNIVITVIDMVKPILDGIVSTIIPMMLKASVSVVNMLSIFTPVIKFMTTILDGVFKALSWVVDKLSEISIFGYKPFGGLSSSSVTGSSSMLEVGNATSSAQFKTSMGGYSYGFGMTSEGFHMGQDVPMASGTPLAPSQVGLVTEVGNNSLYGNYLSMMGADGNQWVFGHMNNVSSRAGDLLMPGEQFGVSGNTGNSIAPHVHVETRAGGRFVDPYTVARTSDNRDVVEAINMQTARLERKLEEVSQQTDENSLWIKNFDREHRAVALSSF